MRLSLLPTTAIVWSVAAAAAVAAPASTVFKDVPAGHWAEEAVTKVAVDRAFMKGYPDGTFRGDQPFTRLQLALAVNELLKELEAFTQTSWTAEGLGGYAFQDLPKDPATRAIVLRLANQYRLFEGVPGVTSKTFESDKQVTRYEMAKVVDRLMRLGEARGVVDPTVQAPRNFAFSDVSERAWAYNEIKDVADRYQVMVGFPDGTFRGPEELTRYQFAATASQTFPLVRELVQKTQEKQDKGLTEVAMAARYLESHPVMIGATGRFDGPMGPGATVRGMSYFGSFFALADLQLAMPVAAGDRLYDGALAIGYALPLGTSFHLQPFLGGRAVTTGANTLGGVTYGLVGYWRPASFFGLYAKGAGTSPLGATAGNPQGGFFGGAGLGAEYYFNQNVGLTLEGGYQTFPATLGTPAAAFATEGAPTGTLGLNFRF